MSTRVRRLLARLRPLHARCQELAKLDDARLLAITPVSGWSIGHHLHHIGLANGQIGGALRKLISTPDELDPARWSPKGRPRLIAHIVLTFGYIPRGRAKAPEFVMPPPAPDPGEVRNLLASAAERLDGLEPLAAGLAACRLRVLHPILGWLKPPQWIRFAAVHTHHHLKVMDDIRSAGAGQ